MAKYRKRQVIIDAVEWNGCNHLVCETFLKGSGAYLSYARKQLGEIIIPTSEGDKIASVGDFIIKNEIGEICPCKPDVFHQKYELID